MREEWEKLEEQILAPWAQKSALSAGRARPEEHCPLRTVYQRDRDRIIHSKAFRRLKHKTQVFVNPQSDHFRTRLTHTLEVTQISRTIARALSLNEDLTEAIALGHDLGHTPFGHAGERALAAILGEFSHNQQSLRVVELIERGGAGLNLTAEVKNGILCHSGQELPASLEGLAVRLSDRIAYINHDIDDALRARIIRPGDLPAAARRLGAGHSERIDTLVKDAVSYSFGKPELNLSPDIAACVDELREYLFSAVYFREEARQEEERLRGMLRELFEYFLSHAAQLPAEYCRQPLTQAVADYIAGMTDSFALAEYNRLF